MNTMHLDEGREKLHEIQVQLDDFKNMAMRMQESLDDLKLAFYNLNRFE